MSKLGKVSKETRGTSKVIGQAESLSNPKQRV